MNSDIAAEVLLGREIYRVGQWLPDGWIGSSETELFSLAHIEAVIYFLTHKLVFSAGISCCILVVLGIGSYLYFVKNIEVPFSIGALFIMLCLIMPPGPGFVELFYLRACYYLPHFFIMFFTLVNVWYILKGKPSKICLFFDYMFALFLGAQGMRGILVIYGPLLATLVCIAFVKLFNKKKIGKHEKSLFLHSIILLVVSYSGTFTNFSIGQSMSTNIRNGFSKLINVVLPDIAWALGLDQEVVGYRVCMEILLTFSLLLLVYALYKLFFRISDINYYDLVYLYFWISTILTAFCVAFTTVGSSCRYFYMMYFVYAFMPIYIYKNIRTNITCFCYIMCVITGFYSYTCIYSPIIKCDKIITDDDTALLEYLVEQGVDKGYANFYNANRLTVVYDELIDISPINDMSKMNMCTWLASTNWYPPYIETNHVTAYIAAGGNDITNLNSFMYDKGEIIIDECDVGRYKVYILTEDLAVLK